MDFDLRKIETSSHSEQMDSYEIQDKDFRRESFKRGIKSRKIQKSRDKVLYKRGSKSNNEQKMKPHLGVELRNYFTPSLSRIAALGGIDLTDEIVREVEGLTALLVVLSGSKDYMTMSAGLFLYVREKFPKSMSGCVIGYIRDALENDFFSQSGAENAANNNDASKNEWIQFIKDIKENWTLCKGNRLFGQFSKIFGLLVTFGLCNADNVTFDIKGYKLIEPDLRVIHGDAQDIISACCDTVVFWVESCYAAWKTRSFTPFLIGNTDASNLDMEYHELVRFWELARNGNLLGMHGVTDAEFVSRLENMATKLRRVIPTLRGLDKQVVERKFSNILSIINDHSISKMAAGYRRAPFAIEFFGPSSQGKTFCAEQVTAALFASAGIDNSKGKKFMFDSSKKHWDGARSDINHFIINDHGNVRSDFVEVSPCDAIQKICDNAPCVAPMADLARKEKTWLEPELVTVTTNVKDLDARLYSNCPYSIQRRMHVVIDVFAKTEFQRVKDGICLGLDSNKVLEKYTIDGQFVPPPFDDVWELTLSVAVPPANLKTGATYRIVEWNGIKMERVDMCTAVNYCIEMFHKHRHEQFELVSLQDARSSDIELCGVDGCVQIKSYCLKHNCLGKYTFDIRKDGTDSCHMILNSDHNFDSHSNEERNYTIGKRAKNVCLQVGNLLHDKIVGDAQRSAEFLEATVSTGILFAARAFVRRFDWITIIPTNWVYNCHLQKIFMLCEARKLRDTYVKKTVLQWSALGAFGILSKSITKVNKCVTLGAMGLGLGFCAIRQSHMVKIVKESYVAELAERNTLHPMLQDIRDKHLARVLKASAIMGVAYTLAKLYRRWRTLEPQGSLEPKSVEEVAQRDKEDNVWSGVSVRKLPLTHKSFLSCQAHLKDIIEKNLVYGTVESGDKKLMVNGLFLRSNVVLVPNHYFDGQEELRVIFRKENPDRCGGKFTTQLHVKSSVLIPETDMRVCYSPNGGSFKDIVDYFPLDHFPSHNFEMIYRLKDGSVKTMEGKARPKRVQTVVSFQGGIYETLSDNTFAGLCGAVLISRGAHGAITGLHLGGHAGTPKGCYGSFVRQELLSAIEQLDRVSAVLLSGTAESFPVQVLGVSIIGESEIHKKNPIKFMPEGSQIEYYGSCPGKTKAVSRVKVTPISHLVTDVCGVPNKWGPPKMNPDWFGWQTCLANLSEPGEPFPHDLISRAVEDYKKPIVALFDSDLWNGASPMNDKENINGVPGVKFLDAIKIGTSIGFPLSGPKSEHMLDVDVFDSNGLLDRKFTEEINLEIARCEAAYMRGERAYAVAKACKKDEILAKEKCRIFYGNSIALTFLVRRYFLPLVRVLMMNPLKSECAVGINSHGPEWDQMMKYLRSKNQDKFLAGDYSKFDQKLPAQVLFAGLRILIDCACRCPGYSANDIRAMKAMAGDLVYSVIAFDGNLIGLTSGGHISGNPLTAVLNSICNSLNMRCCFFTIYPEAQDFREACALITYGDDNAGSVDPRYSDFNIKKCSEVLARYGQVYTMPDKESEMVDFISVDDLEFLKRKTVYHPALKCEVGALSEDSCFKMLHCFLREKNSPLSEVEACALNIDTALMEWFNHGQAIYEKRRDEMKDVARLAKLTNLCTQLHVTYQDKVDQWHERYDPHSGEEEELPIRPLYVQAFSEIPLTAVAMDTPIIHNMVGEVDLIFMSTHMGVHHMLFLEIKDSTLASARSKGRKQLRRLCYAAAVLNPSISYAGVLLSPQGYEPVTMSGHDGYWEDIRLPFSMWRDVREYENAARLRAYGF